MWSGWEKYPRRHHWREWGYLPKNTHDKGMVLLWQYQRWTTDGSLQVSSGCSRPDWHYEAGQKAPLGPQAQGGAQLEEAPSNRAVQSCNRPTGKMVSSPPSKVVKQSLVWELELCELLVLMLISFFLQERLCSIASIKQSGRIPMMIEFHNVQEYQALALLYLTYSEACKAGSLLPYVNWKMFCLHMGWSC